MRMTWGLLCEKHNVVSDGGKTKAVRDMAGKRCGMGVGTVRCASCDVHKSSHAIARPKWTW